MFRRSHFFIALFVSFVTSSAFAEPLAAVKNGDKTPDRAALYARFSEAMTGVKLVGNFTVTGKEGPLNKEEYSILRAIKGEEGDMWLLEARIKYGKHDVTVPIPLEVKWAGDTPVITLNNLAIPGLGTFSSRVVIDGNAYAGTWSHDKVGGHLFGTIEKLKKDEPATKKE